MDWKQVLENFEITPLGDGGISEEDLDQLENKLGRKLPHAYRVFLSKYGESDLEPWVVFPTEGGGVSPGTFTGLDILEKIKDYVDRLPENCIPINDDGGDNLIIMSLDEDKYGEIYFQHHSIGVGEAEDNNENRWKTLAFLAKDFPRFIEGLVLDA
jgi:hypothetical protein